MRERRSRLAQMGCGGHQARRPCEHAPQLRLSEQRTAGKGGGTLAGDPRPSGPPSGGPTACGACGVLLPGLSCCCYRTAPRPRPIRSSSPPLRSACWCPHRLRLRPDRWRALPGRPEPACAARQTPEAAAWHTTCLLPASPAAAAAAGFAAAGVMAAGASAAGGGDGAGVGRYATPR